MRKTVAIGARGGECVVHIRNAEDARGERNLFSGQPVRITGSIPALVVIPDHRPHVAGEIDVGHQLQAGLRVTLHHRPLFGRQRSVLVQHFRRHDDLADVVKQCAKPEPEERPGIHSHAVGEDTSKESHALAVALGVMVLAFDRIAPVVRHLQEPRLERGVSPLDLSDAVRRLQAGVERVRPVEMREHVTVSLLGPIELRQLLGDVGLEKYVVTFLRAFAGAPQVFGCLDVIAALAGDHSDVPKNFAAPGRGNFARKSEQHVDAFLSFVVAAGGDTKLNLVQRDVHFVGVIVLFSKRLRRFRVGAFGFLELTKVGVGETDVVENRRRLITHAERLVARQASLIRFERFVNVASDAGDGAEILVDHGHRLGILGGFRRGSRLPIHQLGAVEVAARLVDDGDYVERLSDFRWRTSLCRSRNRCLQYIHRRAAIPLFQIHASQPAKC